MSKLVRMGNPPPNDLAQKTKVSRSAGRKLLVLSVVAIIFLLATVVLIVGGLIYGAAPILGLRDGRPFGMYGLVVLGVMSFALLAGVYRLLTEKAELPEGVNVTRQAGKTLWKAVDDICAAAAVDPPHHIVISPDMNAFAAEVPTRGLFRAKERVLGLGYPLLKLLSLEQAGAVIAHEVQHFAARDSRASLFNGTVRDAMSLLAPEDGYSNILLAWPARRFINAADRIAAHSSRMAEFAADALAAHLFGARNAADALIVMAAAGNSFEKNLWAPMMKSWEAGAAPPESIMSAIDEAARGRASREAMQATLREELAERTERYSSHPCLAERVAALGVEAHLPEFHHAMSGAQALLWDDEGRVRAELDEFIRAAATGDFEERAKNVARVEAILDREFPKILNRTKTREQAEIISLLMERTLFTEQTRERHEKIVELYGDIPSSVCELAHGKLRLEDAAGAEEMLTVFERHPMMAGEAKKFLEWMESLNGKFPVEHRWLNAWAADPTVGDRLARAKKAYREIDAKVRATFGAKEGFLAHGLEPWHLDLVIEEISSTATVTNIWLVRSPLASKLGFPVFQMLIETEEQLPEAPIGLSTLLCLPGPLQHRWKWTMEPATGDVRAIMQNAASLIYSAKREKQSGARAAA